MPHVAVGPGTDEKQEGGEVARPLDTAAYSDKLPCFWA